MRKLLLFSLGATIGLVVTCVMLAEFPPEMVVPLDQHDDKVDALACNFKSLMDKYTYAK